MSERWSGPLEKIDNIRWKIPKSYKPCMKTDGIIYADIELIESIKQDQAPEQVANVACLPGIIKASMAMPDIHWGYGSAIGGVAAFNAEEGIISPGIAGYDLNCGVRLIYTNLFYDDIKNHIEKIVDQIFKDVPSGLGSEGKIKAKGKDMSNLLIKGAGWAVEKGLGEDIDLRHTEEKGSLDGADPAVISKRAYERGQSQAGTLGSGNHFLEIQKVDEIYDKEKAKVFGLKENQITVMIHTGSRGFGHQVASEALKVMREAVNKYNIDLPDKQLACAPVKSKEGQDYFKAMKCAANFAWCNRQILMHLVRQSFEKVLNENYKSLGMNLIYDVAHNIIKVEENEVNGKPVKMYVHRKGATRAFPPKHPDIPSKYKSIGQPVLIPGDMGTHSYLLTGTESAKETFYSTCHGAGRVMSRHQAKKQYPFSALKRQLEAKGIIVRAHSKGTLTEEAPGAYKNIDKVVEVVEKAGL